MIDPCPTPEKRRSRRSVVMSANETSMIGLCQEKKALLTRSGGAREKFFQVLPLAVFASRRLFLLGAEPDIHLLSQPRRPPQKIKLVISCQSRNIWREHRELALRRPVPLRRDLAGRVPKKLDCFCRCRFTPRRGSPSPRQENRPGGDRWPSNTPPASVPPPGLRDWHFLSAWPGHTVAPVPD